MLRTAYTLIMSLHQCRDDRMCLIHFQTISGVRVGMGVYSTSFYEIYSKGLSCTVKKPCDLFVNLFSLLACLHVSIADSDNHGIRYLVFESHKECHLLKDINLLPLIKPRLVSLV